MARVELMEEQATLAKQAIEAEVKERLTLQHHADERPYVLLAGGVAIGAVLALLTK